MSESEKPLDKDINMQLEEIEAQKGKEMFEETRMSRVSIKIGELNKWQEKEENLEESEFELDRLERKEARSF